jgi:hypothetical protein
MGVQAQLNAADRASVRRRTVRGRWALLLMVVYQSVHSNFSSSALSDAPHSGTLFATPNQSLSISIKHYQPRPITPFSLFFVQLFGTPKVEKRALVWSFIFHLNKWASLQFNLRSDACRKLQSTTRGQRRRSRPDAESQQGNALQIDRERRPPPIIIAGTRSAISVAAREKYVANCPVGVGEFPKKEVPESKSDTAPADTAPQV